jgi:hypothetical protein
MIQGLLGEEKIYIVYVPCIPIKKLIHPLKLFTSKLSKKLSSVLGSFREYAAHVPVHHLTRPSETCNSDAPYQTRPWSFFVLCTCPCPLYCLPGLPYPVLTGEILKTAIGYTVLLPNYQTRTCYLSSKPYSIIHKCYRCIVPLLTCSE